MAKKERTLVLDIGSTAIHAGEFSIDPQTGTMTLEALDNIEFPEYPNEGNRTMIISNALRSVVESGKFTAKNASICVSGQAAFMRFVKLPPVTEDDASVRQIVEYEARQNVPFPMDEVIWDYQLIGSADDDLEVMFAVIKNDIVEGVIDAVENIGLKPKLVDFAPAALYNAARANYIGEEECAMLLDIGGRCTNLLFLDRGRFFARAIPIAGYSITQQIAKEFGISNEEAEVLKRRHGFVALGGAYEEPESEVAATISKIIRNVMTRLHGEINRSINVYRTQQKGNKPTRLYLAGGSSTMQFTDTFFSEKLRMEVTWFNPFKIVNSGPGITPEALQQTFHVMPEVVGVALRSLAECPVEISLVTDSISNRESFNRRKPWLVASAAAWLTLLVVFLVINHAKIDSYQDAINSKKELLENLRKWDTRIGAKIRERDANYEKFDTIRGMLEKRYAWSKLMNDLQECMPLDVWLSSVTPQDAPRAAATGGGGAPGPARSGPFPGSGGGGGGSQGSVITTRNEQIEWIFIHGFCVSIPESSGRVGSGGTFTRPIYTEAQVVKILEAVARTRAEYEQGKRENAPDTDPRVRADMVELNKFEVNIRRNRVDMSTVLPEIFLQCLRHHPSFSPDPLQTAYISFRADDDVKNLTEFEIQVKLLTPIKVTP